MGGQSKEVRRTTDGKTRLSYRRLSLLPNRATGLVMGDFHQSVHRLLSHRPRWWMCTQDVRCRVVSRLPGYSRCRKYSYEYTTGANSRNKGFLSALPGER